MANASISQYPLKSTLTLVEIESLWSILAKASGILTLVQMQLSEQPGEVLHDALWTVSDLIDMAQKTCSKGNGAD